MLLSKNELFTQYSFPSKTIEYMSTGTPVLMQQLPGMPQEYCNYIYLYEEDTEESLQQAIKNLTVQSKNILENKGLTAKRFIVENKNAKKQVQKIIESLINGSCNDG